MRPRANVERKISEVLRMLHELRQGRYFRQEKTELQAQMTAAMVNAKRLFTLTVRTMRNLRTGCERRYWPLECELGARLFGARTIATRAPLNFD